MLQIDTKYKIMQMTYILFYLLKQLLLYAYNYRNFCDYRQKEKTKYRDKERERTHNTKSITKWKNICNDNTRDVDFDRARLQLNTTTESKLSWPE